jgi:hypothetical protein
LRHQDDNPKLRDGLSSWCRACHNEATARWRDKTNYQEWWNAEGRRRYREFGCGDVDAT